MDNGALAQGRRSSESLDSVRTAAWAKHAAPAINVDSLTDQVIRQIDNRVISLRERMGRTT